MTIKPCTRCGSTHRYKNGNCRDCHHAWMAKQILKPCSICGANDRYPSGPCKPCQLKRAAQRDPEKQKESDRKYRYKNRDAYLERVRQWRTANKDKVRESERAKEARRRGAVGKLSKGIERRLFAEQNGLCVCCGRDLGDNYHLDHIMPLALGGTNTDDNVQLLLAECNLRKGAMHPDEWRKTLVRK